MRKFIRILAIVILAFIFFSSLYSSFLMYDLYARNIITDMGLSSNLFVGVLSLCSLLFGVYKFLPSKVFNRGLHNFLRFADFISLAVFLFYLLYSVVAFVISAVDKEFKIKQLLVLPIVLVSVSFCIYLILDNFYYQKQIVKRELLKSQLDIDTIGQ